MGTISGFTNVSLAVYYLLAIKFGESERQLKERRKFLVACPILVGSTFAFAGIPFYGNMILWCDNTASWWPDVPVVIAILSATVIMGILCWDVFKKEKVSARWRGGGDTGRARNKLSSQVFWQSFFYLLAFYLTWPAYIVLQYSWAADSFFSNYGLLLAAGAMVPLQGFWNFIVYIRPRQYKQASVRLRRASSRFRGRFQTQTTEDSTTRSFMLRLHTFPTPSSQKASTRNTSEAIPRSNHNVASRSSSNGPTKQDNMEMSASRDEEAAVVTPVKDGSIEDGTPFNADSPVSTTLGDDANDERKTRADIPSGD